MLQGPISFVWIRLVGHGSRHLPEKDLCQDSIVGHTFEIDRECHHCSPTTRSGKEAATNVVTHVSTTGGMDMALENKIQKDAVFVASDTMLHHRSTTDVFFTKVVQAMQGSASAALHLFSNYVKAGFRDCSMTHSFFTQTKERECEQKGEDMRT